MTGYAGFWLRLVAYIIDTAIVAVLVFVLAAVGILPVSSNPEAEPLLSAVNLIAEVIALLYWSLFEASAVQATPGKLAVGIRVTDTAGARLGFGRALLRNVLKILSFLILLIGYLMAAFTRRKQALHDLMAGTLVVRRGEEALEQAFRFREADGQVARILCYAFCPDAMREIGEELGVPVRTGLYRYPTPAPGKSY